MKIEEAEMERHEATIKREQIASKIGNSDEEDEVERELEKAKLDESDKKIKVSEYLLEQAEFEPTNLEKAIQNMKEAVEEKYNTIERWINLCVKANKIGGLDFFLRKESEKLELLVENQSDLKDLNLTIKKLQQKASELQLNVSKEKEKKYFFVYG